MAKMMSLRDLYDGLHSPGGGLAKAGDSKGEIAGHAVRGAIEGGVVGAAVGAADSLLPGGVGPKSLGAVALVALAGSVAFASKPLGRTLANVTVAASALAAREYAGNKTAHHAGTANSVLTNKAKAIAAHGESAGYDAGEDRLITEGAKIVGG